MHWTVTLKACDSLYGLQRLSERDDGCCRWRINGKEHGPQIRRRWMS